MYCTYLHRRNDTGAVFYIGKGSFERAGSTRGRNAWWRRVVAKTGFTAQVLATWPTEADAFEHEKFLIACFRGMGVGLCNLTDGGEGPAGHRHTEETKARISAASRGKPGRKWTATQRTAFGKRKAAAGATKQVLASVALAQQARRKMVTEDGVTQSLSDWARQLGASTGAIGYRHAQGLSLRAVRPRGVQA